MRAAAQDATSSAASGEIILQRMEKVYDGQQGAVRALLPVDLHIAAGQNVSIVGPSGCGKSTLMRMVAGLESITAGSAQIDGRKVTGPIPNAGIVFQRDLLLEWRTVIDNVMLPAEFRPSPHGTKERAHQLLEHLGVGGFEASYPYQLSGGMRQRVSIARALLCKPSMLFLDEPFSALDALTRDQMNVLFREVQSEQNVSTLLITHSIAEAIFLADRVIVMSGRPGSVLDDIEIDFPGSRTLALRETPEFTAIVRRIRTQFEKAGVFTA